MERRMIKVVRELLQEGWDSQEIRKLFERVLLVESMRHEMGHEPKEGA